MHSAQVERRRRLYEQAQEKIAADTFKLLVAVCEKLEIDVDAVLSDEPLAEAEEKSDKKAKAKK